MASRPWPVASAGPVPDDDPHTWRAVRVFVSSTFSDMHAERDLLVKRVFPRLRFFCEKRRLWLLEVDLRWGVTEEEATANSNAVGVCLRGVERSEVFLGFLGQRYGWQPGAAELEEAEREFPALARVAQDRLSVTEMEIQQALGILPRTLAGADHKPPKAHLFYRRDASYLQHLPPDASVLLYRIYRDDDSPGDEQRNKREELEKALEPLIVDYQAKWIPSATTPELRFSLRAPSTDEPSVERWQRTWRDHAGLTVEDAQIPADSELRNQAEHFNARLARGRLGEFRAGAQALADRLVADLEATVERAFPTRVPSRSEDLLSLDLEQQEAFLMKAIEGFVERPLDRVQLDHYRAAPDQSVLFMAAPSGSGKTTLLAKWIQTSRTDDPRTPVLFRFIGASDRSTRIEDLLRSLLGEVQRRTLPSLSIPETDRELRLVWLDLLVAALAGRRAILVVDGLDKLDTGLDDLTWLPTRLPESLGLIASFGLEGEKAEDLRHRIEHDALAALVACEPFADSDKERLIDRFLDPGLKRMDARHVKSVLSFQGARLLSAPLFLKVVLSEIRLFGSFQNIEDEVQRPDGTPESAFGRLMARLQDGEAYSPFPASVVLATVLPALALARNGLDAQELGEILLTEVGRPASMQDALDAVHLAIHPLRALLATRAGRFAVSHSSLKSAIIARFASGDGGVPSVRIWHEKLAQLFEGQRCGTAASSRWLSELPYHLAASGQHEALVALLSDLTFIEAKYAAGLGPELLADYDRIADAQALSRSAHVVWNDFRRFVRAHHAVLQREPALTHQQALNEPDASAPHRVADGLTLSLPTSLFRWNNKPQKPVVDAEAGPASGAELEGAEQNAGLDRQSGDEISAVELGPQQMVAGDTAGWIHILDAQGTHRHRLHDGQVTSVMQLADGTVVSTGSDGRISILACESKESERHQVHVRGLLCSASDAECQQIAVGDDGGEVSILAVEGASLRIIARFGTRDGHAVQALTWLPMGGLFVLATKASIETRALPDRRAIGSFPHEVGIPVCLVTIPGTATLTTVGQDGRVSSWDSSAPQPDIQRQRLPLAQVTAAAFLSRRELLTTHTTGEIALWQWPELLRVGLMPTSQRLQAIAADVRTRRVVAAGSGGRPLLFDLRGR